MPSVIAHNQKAWDAEVKNTSPILAAAGFMITGFAEDYQPHPRFVIDHYLPTFLSTCAIKAG